MLGTKTPMTKSEADDKCAEMSAHIVALETAEEDALISDLLSVQDVQNIKVILCFDSF